MVSTLAEDAREHLVTISGWRRQALRTFGFWLVVVSGVAFTGAAVTGDWPLCLAPVGFALIVGPVIRRHLRWIESRREWWEQSALNYERVGW